MVQDDRRRRFLKYGGVLAGTALAGCTGGGDGGDGGSDGGDGSSDGSGGGSDGGDGSGGGDGGGDGGDGGDGGSDGGDVSGTTIQMYGIDEFETRDIGKGLEEEHGVSIETTVLLGGQNSARYVQEHNNGVHTADVVQGFDENMANLVIHENDDDHELLADPELPNFDKVWSDEYLDFMGNRILSDMEAARKMVPLGGFLSCHAYNPDLVDEPPQSWEDLLEPRFKDEMILLTYNVDGIWDHYSREYDEEAADEFIVALDEQNPQYISGSPLAAAQKVGAGEAKLAPDSFTTHAIFLAEQGLKLEWNWPEEFIWYHTWGVMLMEHAPNFEAAKTFCQYAASKEGQENFSHLFGGCNPAHEDLPHGNPEAEEARQQYEGSIRRQAQWPELEQRAESHVSDLIDL